ncbi:MAG: lysophospholipid acyltransferase family protein [Anaerolineaceae bacterium]|nr:lysophospholipid acyltransferase family protein [Anaerolineaceae bacterium]
MAKVPDKVFNFLEWLVDKLVVITVEGSENLPKKGACLVTTAHTSRLDTVFLMVASQRRDGIPLVAREYKKSILGPLLNAIGVIWLDRSGSDFKALQQAADYIKKGWMLGIAPEGKRSRTGALLPGKPGAALIAKKFNVQVVPSALEGSTDMWYWFKRFQKMRVTVHFGPLYTIPGQAPEEDNKSWLARATEEIMCHIAVLLPPERRGFYADNPRMKELLASKNREADER